MTRKKEIERLIAGRLFGDLSPQDEERIDELIAGGHIDSIEIDSLQATLDVAGRRERKSADPAFMIGLSTRVVEHVEAPGALSIRHRLAGAIDALAAHILPNRRWAIQASLVAAALVVGVLLGRSMFSTETEAGPSTVGSSAQSRQNELLSVADRTSNYIGRSKILLLGIVNDEPTADYSRHRDVATDLAATAGQLRLELDSPGNRRLTELVSEIEVILLQIANLESARDEPAVEMIRRGVDRNALLLRINIEQLEPRPIDAAASSSTGLPPTMML